MFDGEIERGVEKLRACAVARLSFQIELCKIYYKLVFVNKFEIFVKAVVDIVVH